MAQLPAQRLGLWAIGNSKTGGLDYCEELKILVSASIFYLQLLAFSCFVSTELFVSSFVFPLIFPLTKAKQYGSI